MNLRTLEQFLALAEHLHFGRAAEAANLSVSALSRNVRQLEGALGARLFERDNRSVALTSAGERLRPWARETVGGWTALRRELSGGAGALSGRISLHCSVTASYGLLAELLGRFRRDYPGIGIGLHTGDPEHGIARVVAGEEQLAIAARPDRLPRGTLFRPLATSPLVFVAPRDANGADLPPAGAADASRWAGVPMIVAETGVARRRVDAWFRGLGTVPRVHAQVAGNEAIVAMVALGLGVGVVPRLVLDASPQASRVRVLDASPALAPYEVGLVTLGRHLADPLVAAFWTLAPEDAPPAGRARRPRRR